MRHLQILRNRTFGHQPPDGSDEQCCANRQGTGCHLSVLPPASASVETTSGYGDSSSAHVGKSASDCDKQVGSEFGEHHAFDPKSD